MRISLRSLILVVANLMLATSSFAGNGPPPPGYIPPSNNASYAPAPPPPPPPPNGDKSAAKIDPVANLLSISHKAVSGMGETATFKIVYDVKNHVPNLVNTNAYKYHFDWVTSNLGYSKSVDIFNKNYSGDLGSREFVLGSVMLVKNKSLALGYQALFELWSGDNLDAAGIKIVIADVQNSLPNGLPLKFHPLSTDHERIAQQNFKREDYVLTSDLIGNRQYLIFNMAEAYGYLRFASQDPTVENEFDLTTIAVFDKVPNDIGLVGGVITAEPQTPLSHVNVKSMNRGTMNIYVHNARNVLKNYENKPVRISFAGSKPVITVLSESDAQVQIANFWKKKQPKLKGKPQFVIDKAYANTFIPLHSVYTNLPTREQHSQWIQKVGAKAANLGLLDFLSKKLGLFESPMTLGIPFNFYDDFMNLQQKGLDTTNPSLTSTPLIETKKILNKYDLLNPTIVHALKDVRAGLNEIKQVYSRAKVPANLLSAFKRFIFDDSTSPIHISKTTRIRLRSSTNSEDLDGFTGAGLYDSDGVSLYKKRADDTYDQTQPLAWQDVEKKLSKVVPALYSSVWNERAFQEREWYQMNGTQHLDVKVGLALHNAFPLKDFNGIAENANGVAVTTNIYDSSEWGKIYINGQHYDLSVTNPPDAKDLIALNESTIKSYATEELLVTSYTSEDVLNQNPNSWKQWPVQYLGRSSIKNGESIFKSDELLRFSHALFILNKEMAKVYGKQADKFPIDIEWKIYGPQRKLVIKQARPLTVTPKLE